jgi:GNAT superfamily N-acetyltransferase
MDIARIDGNLFEFYEYAAQAGRKPCSARDGFSVIALEPSPWANAVYRLDFPEGRELGPALSTGIRGLSIPNQIRVGPSSRPKDIEARLVSAGFVLENEARGMILDPARRKRVQTAPDLSLRPITSEEDFRSFAAIVVAELFDTGPSSGLPFARLLSSLAGDRAFGFLGTHEGRDVSTAFAFIDGERGGGLYFVATEGSMRGRGYAKAAVGAVLDELELRGCGSCILHATPLGKPVYESLGFADACRLARYRYGDES